MEKLRKCPKCQSRLVEQTKDEHGEYAHCILCGYVAEEIDPRTMIEISLSIAPDDNPNARLRSPRMGDIRKRRALAES